jgi:hypothetical protein
MAEWLSTDFLERSVASPSGIGEHFHARFREIEAALADRADHIEKAGKCEQNRETKPEKQLGGEQFAHEIHLRNEGDTDNRDHALTNAYSFAQPECQAF